MRDQARSLGFTVEAKHPPAPSTLPKVLYCLSFSTRVLHRYPAQLPLLTLSTKLELGNVHLRSLGGHGRAYVQHLGQGNAKEHQLCRLPVSPFDKHTSVISPSHEMTEQSGRKDTCPCVDSTRITGSHSVVLLSGWLQVQRAESSVLASIPDSMRWSPLGTTGDPEYESLEIKQCLKSSGQLPKFSHYHVNKPT